MQSKRKKNYEKALRNGVEQILGGEVPQFAPLVELIREISQKGVSVIIFGGLLRDLMIHGKRSVPRDFDIVIDGLDQSDCNRFLETYLRRRTRFGGWHLEFKGWPVDVWPLEETWGFKHVKLEPSLQNLTKTTFLNVEAVAVQIRSDGVSREYLSPQFLTALREKILDINLVDNPFPELAAVRTLITARKLKFDLSESLARYVLEHIPKESTHLERIQISHYGKVRGTSESFEEQLRMIKAGLESGKDRIPATIEEMQTHFWNA